MTTLLSKLVIDITALPGPEQAPDYVILEIPIYACVSKSTSSFRIRRRITIKQGVHYYPPMPRPRHRRDRFPHPRRHLLLPSPQRHDAVRCPRRLSDPQDLLPPRLQPDRPDHRFAPDHRVASSSRWSGFIPTLTRSLIRSPSAWDSPSPGSFSSPPHPATCAILVAVALVGVGSAVFHPESSRIARLASGGQHGLAQSLFQVGGNAGSSTGPLLAAFIVLPKGQGQHRLVLHRRTPRDPDPDAGRQLVQNPSPADCQTSGTGAALDPVSAKSGHLHEHSHRAHFFEIYLPGQLHQLLHLLSDR